MEPKPNFRVIYSKEALEFIQSLPAKAQDKIISNVRKSSILLDPKFFKKLEKEIWEFRTRFNNIQYRLLAFWDNTSETLVIATHGFIKKTQKTVHSFFWGYNFVF
jgi:phage-related protein